MTAAQQNTRPATTVDAVLDRMHRIGSALPPGDGVAVFNRVYLSVTEELARRLDAGRFTDRGSAAKLAVRFAGLYLDAVAAESAGRTPPACWRPLFGLRGHPSVHVLQFALAGINAHIGHDLPLALVGSCRAQNAEPADLEGDFLVIGELLTGLEERIREELMPGPDVLEAADPLTHLMGTWSLGMARAGAWTAFRALWWLRGLPDLAEEFTERLDAGVGLAGRCLLTPLPG